MQEDDDDGDVDDDETEEGEVGNVDSRSSSILNDQTTSKSEKTNNDLLEGISDEDLVSFYVVAAFFRSHYVFAPTKGMWVFTKFLVIISTTLGVKTLAILL
jgi:hypothetical protein